MEHKNNRNRLAICYLLIICLIMGQYVSADFAFVEAASIEASGEASGNASGEASVDASGEASGNASGEASSNVSGDASGEASGDASGEASGDASGDASGEASGDASGEASGNASENTENKPPIVYQIQYYLNGGKLYNAPTEYRQGEAVAYEIPTKKGHSFMGWFLDETLTIPAGEGFQAGHKGTVVLYANWQKEIYTISYNLAGGKFVKTNPSTYVYQSTFGLYPAKRKGYSFSGWYNAADGSKETKIKSSYAENLVLVAKWKKVSIAKAKKMKLSEKNQSVTAKIAKVSGAKGYEFQYWRAGQKSKLKTIVASKNSIVVKKLKQGKRYYFKCRAFSYDSYGNRIYGKFCNKKTIKIKKIK